MGHQTGTDVTGSTEMVLDSEAGFENLAMVDAAGIWARRQIN